MHRFTSKECNLINQQHKEYNFSSGNKAVLDISFFFPPFLLELKHNTKYTVICKITHRPLRSIWINIDDTYLQHSKAILKCNINIADMNACMHILNAYEVTMVKHLHLLKVWHHLQSKNKSVRGQYLIRRHGVGGAYTPATDSKLYLVTSGCGHVVKSTLARGVIR